MSPRRRVVIFSALEMDLAATVFAIETRAMWARAATEPEAFAEQLASFHPNAALLYYDGAQMEAGMRACEGEAYDAGVPVLIVSRVRVAPDIGSAAMVLPWNAAMAVILESLRILAARKRGPRKIGAQRVELIRQYVRNAAAASMPRRSA